MDKLLRAVAILATGIVLLLTAACGASGTPKPASAPGGTVSIVVAFYPFQFIAQRVAGDHATVTSLTSPGQEPHDLELTPKQVASISDAGLVVYERSFQAAVDEAVAQSGNPSTLDTATVVPLQDLGTKSEEAGARVDQRFLDPHVWLDPNNFKTIASAVARRLETIDPPHASDYTKNAEALNTQLTSLDHQYRAGLASCQRTQFITQHAAFGYLARRYGLTQIAIGGLSPDIEPSPSRIADVQQQARTLGITTVFYETLVSPAVAEAIAGDLRLKTDVLDPIEGITPQSKGQDYVAVMLSNLASLRAANQCR